MTDAPTRTRGNRRRKVAPPPPPSEIGPSSGVVRVLTDADKTSIHKAALEILATVGFSEAPDHTRNLLLDFGCEEGPNGRILFPSALVENCIARANRSLVLYGQKPEHDLEVSGSRTYFSTGCGSVSVMDPAGRTIRPTDISDVYDFARLVDRLENIHMFHRLGIPSTIADVDDVDINLCYACVRGTSKPVSTSWFNGENVKRSLDMLHTIAGGEAAWRARPFVSNGCTFVVPPLKFAFESCAGLEHAVRGGMPVQLISSGQLGATAPVTVAGVAVQTMAEVLGGLVYALAVSPDAQVMLGTWPLVSDLRTGAATTGSPEQALVSAAVCQMSRFYDIPNGCVSGIADSKLPDAQAAMEKTLQHTFIGNAGGNVMFCSAGALAGGLGCSHRGLVIDNEIIGSALRTARGFKVDAGELSVETIRNTCIGGEGHYLGDSETLARMRTGFFYPSVADRTGLNDWMKAGKVTFEEKATSVADSILASHYPGHVSDDADAAVREAFEIFLPDEKCRLPN
jgi:trimethylamine--corrinoid protein Co-methyltransferase